jgi:hypothetical protein
MTLPKDGEFHGSFSLAYYHTTSKGKQKERSKVIPESGVKIKFSKIDDSNNEYKVDGTGVNQFGIFHINGTAKPTPTHEDDGQYSIELRKRYDSSATAAATATGPAMAGGVQGGGGGADGGKKMNKKSKKNSLNNNSQSSFLSGKLPQPSESYEKNVVCLRGKLAKEGDQEQAFNDPHQLLGNENVVHSITGMWSSGLDFLLSDPDNTRGLCNRFEYEHKSSSPNASFPVSGRYSGWFDLNNEEGGKTKISEKDITLRFRKNSGGYHNVEGKGSNAFGKYTITGTLTNDNVVTIFRHFLPKKVKSSANSSSGSSSSKLVTSAPPPINAPGQTRKMSPQRHAPGTTPAIKLTLNDIVIPNDGGDGGPAEPLKPPDHPTYSAVSRGVLRVNEDASHSCQGKWAMTREHFTNGQTSNFNFRLEPHHSDEAMKKSTAINDVNGDPRPFPLDSDTYKGSFELKKGGGRKSTIVDTQVVMKFRENTAGTYNVHGRGVNEIGVFDLLGTLIASGKTGGQVELYRIYLPELLAQQPVQPSSSKGSKSKKSGLPGGSNLPPMSAKRMSSGSYSTMLPGPPRAAAATGSAPMAVGSSSSSGAGMAMSRRESTRLVKVPSRLEDDDPEAQFTRIMDKCNVLLRIIREKDVEMGAFFSEPVDPIALGIPTYPQVIKEPMDLRTLHRKMEATEVRSPEEFARLNRLVFENAVMFNVDPTNSVHQAARNLLILFNQKYRDIERQIAGLRRGGIPDDGKGKKGDKKRKRGGGGAVAYEEEIKSMKRQRLDEAHEMAISNSQAMTSLIGAAPPPSTNDAGVTRKEFNIMLSMIQKLQHQTVQTYTVLAELSSDDPESSGGGRGISAGVGGYGALASSAGAPSNAKGTTAGKKKPKKKADAPKKEAAKKKEQQHHPAVAEDDSNIPLTLQEQELLTDTIPELAPDNLHGVIQIIRDAAKLTGEEDEIDLEIDQLDTQTQRKLLRYVTKVRMSYILIFLLSSSSS